MKKYLIFALVYLSAFTFSQKYKAAKVENEIKSLMYQFWVFYESEKRDIDHYLTLFVDKDLELSSTLHPGKPTDSHKELLKRIERIPVKQKNSHKVHYIKLVKKIDEKHYSFVAQNTYKTIGVDGKALSVKLNYKGVAYKDGNDFPKIKKLAIAPASKIKKITPSQYEDVYRENKVKALLYYWYSLFDLEPGGKIDDKKIVDLVDEKIQMDLSFAAFTSKQQLRNWVKTIPGQTKKSAHHVSNIRYVSLGKKGHRAFYSLYFQMVDLKGNYSEYLFDYDVVLKESSGRFPIILRYNLKQK